jgi:hypothetical protein
LPVGTLAVVIESSLSLSLQMLASLLSERESESD